MKYALLALFLCACRVGDDTISKTSVERRDQRPVIPSGAARCDPEMCPSFCARMGCVFGGLGGGDGVGRCTVVCEARCGDAYFEVADEALVGCVVDGPVGAGCAKQEMCCIEHFTSALCAE